MQDGLFYASAAVGLAAIMTAGCTDSSSATPEASVPVTAMAMEPINFLGDVPCSSKAGSLQSYVVTLTDVTDSTTPVTLPSSPPTPCSRGIRFRYILDQHRYTAEVDGYDVPADELIPSGTPAPAEGQPTSEEGLPGSGSRHMLLRSTKALLEPRWTTSCSEQPSILYTTRVFTTCDPLVDHGSPGATSIRVDPRAALGELRCAAEGGEVAFIDVKPASAGLDAVTNLECGASPVDYAADITPGTEYSFRLEARAEGSAEVRWGASCFAVADEGLRASAACGPFSSTGVIEVGAPALVDAGIECGGEVKGFEVYVIALGLSSGPVACGESARVLGLPPGSYDLEVRKVGANGPEKPGAQCTAQVEPGATSAAACSKAP